MFTERGSLKQCLSLRVTDSNHNTTEWLNLSMVYSHHEILHSNYQEGGRSIYLDIEGIVVILLNKK